MSGHMWSPFMDILSLTHPPPPDKTMYMLLCIVYIMVGLTCTTTIIEIIRSWGLL